MSRKSALVALLVVVFSVGGLAQSKDPWKVKPATLPEALRTLDLLFDDTTRYSFMMFPERVATSNLHFPFGMWMRNNWGLWGRSPLHKEMEALGFVHPDDMSAAILTAYHRSLRGSPLQLDELAAGFREYWARDGSVVPHADISYGRAREADREATLALFHPGDTIAISIYASYRKLFTTYASGLRGIAVVRGRVGDELKVTLLSLEEKRRHTAKKRVGETFSTAPWGCVLIPPRGWAAQRPLLPADLR